MFNAISAVTLPAQRRQDHVTQFNEPLYDGARLVVNLTDNREHADEQLWLVARHPPHVFDPSDRVVQVVEACPNCDTRFGFNLVSEPLVVALGNRERDRRRDRGNPRCAQRENNVDDIDLTRMRESLDDVGGEPTQVRAGTVPRQIAKLVDDEIDELLVTEIS